MGTSNVPTTFETPCIVLLYVLFQSSTMHRPEHGCCLQIHYIQHLTLQILLHCKLVIRYKIKLLSDPNLLAMKSLGYIDSFSKKTFTIVSLITDGCHEFVRLLAHMQNS